MALSDLGPYPNESGYDIAVALDSRDSLAEHRDHFVHSDPDLIYLDGNSLGRQPIGAKAIVDEASNRQWGDRLIRSWNEGWWELQLRLGDKLAPIVGAQPGEVIVSDSTSVNLYKLALAAVMGAGEGRSRIITDDLNFPSDIYILEGIAQQTGAQLEIIKSDGIHGPVQAIADAVDRRTALVSLSHTTFQSGYTYDMAAVTDLAQNAGAMVLWDLSHSVGAVPIDLTASGADLAIGCTYKYLNGGPGSPAFLYIREDLQNSLVNPITGWWGHARPFDFALGYTPVSGIRRFHAGTMPVLSLAAIEPGIEEILHAGIDALRAKSVDLATFLVEQHTLYLEPLGFALASPTDPTVRGSHIALAHESAWPITRAAIEEALVIPDFRTPDRIRLGLTPLYTSFVDVHTAVQRIRRVVAGDLHRSYVDTALTVT